MCYKLIPFVLYSMRSRRSLLTHTEVVGPLFSAVARNSKICLLSYKVHSKFYQMKSFVVVLLWYIHQRIQYTNIKKMRGGEQFSVPFDGFSGSFIE